MSTQKNRLAAAFIVPFLLFFWSSTGWAALYVSTSGSDITGTGGQSNPFATIQHSADVAPNGETIFVSQGIYNENININGKNLNLYGGYDASDWSRNITANETIIDGGGLNTVLYIRDSDIVIDGFTLQNGQAGDIGGGGIDLRNGTSEIRNCILKNNNAIGINAWGGGGILIGLVETGVTILNCKIIENYFSRGAIGIRIGGSQNVMIKNTVIAKNTGSVATTITRLA